MPSPIFMRGDDVTLHPVEEADLEFLQEVVNDPEVRHGLAMNRPVSLADEREWFESEDDDGVQFLIRAGEDGTGERVGSVSFSDVNDDWGTAEVAYFVHPDHWGNGYAPAAVRRLVEYGFTERRLEKVWARVFAFNDASQRVLEKAGFDHEATLPDQAHVHGRRVDMERYGLLAADWKHGELTGDAVTNGEGQR